MVPIVQSTFEDIQGYLVDKNVQNSFMNKRPFLITESRENQDK